jgi:hypothetical protein
MHTIKPFDLKIIETTPVSTIIHNSKRDYDKNKLTSNLAQNSHYKCEGCKELHNTKDKFSKQCIYLKRTFSPNALELSGTEDMPWLLRHFVMKEYINPNGHKLTMFANVKTELGDEVTEESKSYQERSGLADGSYWLSSSISPLYRGMLIKGEYNESHYYRYRHYPLHVINGYCYRRPKTNNERRQIDACTIDEFSPSIRARRGYQGLPSAWDDIRINIEGNWKRKKIKKQWQINISKD